MRAITIKKFVSAHTAGSMAGIVLQLLHSDNRHKLVVSACGASNCQVRLAECCVALYVWDGEEATRCQ